MELQEKPLNLKEVGTLDIDSIYKSNRLKPVIINGERVLMYE